MQSPRLGPPHCVAKRGPHGSRGSVRLGECEAWRGGGHCSQLLTVLPGLASPAGSSLSLSVTRLEGRLWASPPPAGG